MNTIQKELDDILPAYNTYLNNKLKYQSQELDADPMIVSFRLVCQELQDFLIMLYCGTDTYKERRELQQMLEWVQHKLK